MIEKESMLLFNLLSFVKKNGIKRQCTTTYTPQPNGVAERKNITLIEMARCLLQSKKLHNMYWVEAMRISSE